MTTKQAIYTGALHELGGRKALTSESTEPRRVLDDHYDDVVKECLSAGSWNFATDEVKMDGDTGLVTYADTGSIGTGLQYGFTKPSGWLRTHGMSGDEYFSWPLLEYTDQNELIRADITPIYMRYVSSDTGLGYDLVAWTPLFRRYVQLELASRVAYRFTQNAALEDRIMKRRDKAKTTALNQDAMDEPNPKFRPPGSWSQSRWGRSSGRDMGSRNRFTG